VDISSDTTVALRPPDRYCITSCRGGKADQRLAALQAAYKSRLLLDRKAACHLVPCHLTFAAS